MFHFGNYAVLSWHRLQIQIGRWNGTTFFTSGIFGFKIWHPAAAIKPWSRIACKQHGDLFCYVAQLPEHRWVRRMLAWNPAIRARQLGRPRHTWDQKVTAFCRYKQHGHWMEYAQYKKAWLALSGSFYNFCIA